MFEQELKELNELGKSFVNAFTTIANATNACSAQQINIIHQARKTLIESTNVQASLCQLGEIVIDGMEDVCESLDETYTGACIMLDHLQSAEAIMQEEEEEVE